MSNDRYTGNTFADLNAGTPEDIDDVGVDAAAIRQIKRYLTLPSGFAARLGEQIADENSGIGELLHGYHKEYRVGDVIQSMSSTFDPNEDQEKFPGVWTKQDGSMLMATGTVHEFNKPKTSFCDTWIPNITRENEVPSTNPRFINSYSEGIFTSSLFTNMNAGIYGKTLYWYTAINNNPKQDNVRISGWFKILRHNLASYTVQKYGNLTIRVSLSNYAAFNPIEIVNLGELSMNQGWVLNFDRTINLTNQNTTVFIVISMIDPVGGIIHSDPFVEPYGLTLQAAMSAQISTLTTQALKVELGNRYQLDLPITGVNIWRKIQEAE